MKGMRQDAIKAIDAIRPYKGRNDVLWRLDRLHVSTWSGFACVALIIDAFSRALVGWRVAMTAGRPGPRRLGDGHQESAVAAVGRAGASLGSGSAVPIDCYTERLAEAGAVTSVGSRGDSYDNALAETVVWLYKTELIRRGGP